MVNENEISIIIPCFNVQKRYIERALESVANQTFQNYQIIVVDDGSEDRFHKELEAIVQKYPKCTLITSSHMGVSNARNVGINQSEGNYVAFLDADDVLVPCFFEHAIETIKKYDADYIIGGLKQVDEKDQYHFEKMTGPPEIRVYIGEEEINHLRVNLLGCSNLIRFDDSYIGRGPVCRLIRSEVVKKSLFKIGISDGEDIIWNQKVLFNCQKVCICLECWYLYVKNPNSATRIVHPELIDQKEAQLVELENTINLNNDGIYVSYMDHVYEEIRDAWIKHYRLTPIISRRSVHQVEKRLYNEMPWKKISRKRYFRLANNKRKISIALYYLHLLFLGFRLQEKLR